MNVTIYGDSILKGILLENGRYTINRKWEQAFAQQYDIELKNRSRFGCTIQKALSLILRDAETAGGEDEYVLLELGGNDCDYDWARISEEPSGSYDCKTPPEQFISDYRTAVRTVREGGRTPVLATLPPIHSKRYLRFICRDGLSEKNILKWLGDVEAIYRWQKMYSDMVERVAGEEGAKLIDLRAAFARSGRPTEELLCDDGIHPSRAGQAIIFRTLCGAIG